MKFNFSKEIDVIRFRERGEYLIRKKEENVELIVRRTIPQNSYLHLILGWFAIESGNTIKYVKEEYYKRLVNPDIFIREKQDKYVGKVLELRSSTKLTTSEMATSIERFRNWSSMEAGIYLPADNEDKFLKHINEEIERNKIWL